MRTVSIIGAGASGLACLKALLPYQDKIRILIFDRNSIIAKKIAATGNGHCNLSNQNLVMDAYGGDIEQVFSMIESFNIEQFCHELGFLTRLKGPLYYPYSEQAKTVVNAFQKMISNSSAELFLNTQITNIHPSNKGYLLTDQNHKTYYTDVIVVAAGSKAGKGFSTDGSIYSVLSNLGLKSTLLQPSLVALNTKESVKKLKGCRVHGTFTLKKDNQFIKSYSGELLFTDSGVSGIACMQLSRFFDSHSNAKYTLHCNLIDTLSDEVLFDYYHSSANLYEGVVQEKIAEYLNYRPVTSFEEFKNRLNNLTFTIIGTRDHEHSQVTKGGIPLSYLNENLMVKQYPNLYLCGEVLNIDGDCGGYNLHFAFASGTTVGKDIVASMNFSY